MGQVRLSNAEANERRRHFNMSETGFVSQMKTTPVRRTRVMCWWTNPNRPPLKILATASARTGRRPIARRLLAHDYPLRPLESRTGATRGRVRWHLHQRRRQSILRGLQPTQCLLRHCTRQLRAQPAQAVSAEHKLRRPIVSLYDPSRREDERPSRHRVPGRARNRQ